MQLVLDQKAIVADYQKLKSEGVKKYRIIKMLREKYLCSESSLYRIINVGGANSPAELNARYGMELLGIVNRLIEEFNVRENVRTRRIRQYADLLITGNFNNRADAYRVLIGTPEVTHNQIKRTQAKMSVCVNWAKEYIANGYDVVAEKNRERVRICKENERKRKEEERKKREEERKKREEERKNKSQNSPNDKTIVDNAIATNNASSSVQIKKIDINKLEADWEQLDDWLSRNWGNPEYQKKFDEWKLLGIRIETYHQNKRHRERAVMSEYHFDPNKVRN